MSLVSLVEKLRQEQEFVTFYKSQLRSGVQELNTSCDNVFHSLWVAAALSQGLGRVLSHAVPPADWSHALQQAVVFVDANKVLQSHTYAYSKFLSSLEPRLLADILVIAESDGADTQWLLNDLISVVFGHCLFSRDHTHFLSLLRELMTQHIIRCPAPGDLFSRGESIFCRAVKEYCSTLLPLKPFLADLLGPTISKVLLIDDYLEYDMGKAGSRYHGDSNREASFVSSSVFLFGEDLEGACLQLASLATGLVNKLIEMGPLFPTGIKWLLGMIRKFATKKWSMTREQQRRLISEALFGVILGSALLHPEHEAVVEQGLLLGRVSRYNLSQLCAVLQQASWAGDSLPITKVTKRIDLVAYNSLLDGLSECPHEQVPGIPSRLPGLKRSSFLASHRQLNNLVGLAASLLTNRQGRGAFHTHLSTLLSTLPHTLIDSGVKQPYTTTPLTNTHPSTDKKPRSSRYKKRGSSLSGGAQYSTDPSSSFPRSRSAAGLDSVRGGSPPGDRVFSLPGEVLILPFPDEIAGDGEWNFHLLEEDEFMTPTSPLPNLMLDESPSELPSPAEALSHAISSSFSDSLRIRANTLPPNIIPGGDRGSGLLTEEPMNSWSPTKGAWLSGALKTQPTEENPYDRLQSRDAYIETSDSSAPTSPTTPSVLATPTSQDPGTPTTAPSLADTFGEVSHDIEMAPHEQSEEELLIEQSVSAGQESPTGKKHKRRLKLWRPFRKHKSVDQVIQERKPRSHTDAANLIIEPQPLLSHDMSHDNKRLAKRSYTILTGHITAKYAAQKARERVASKSTEAKRPPPLPSKWEAERDSLLPSDMSLPQFKASLYCRQLQYKLRGALQNIHTPLQEGKSPELPARSNLILLIQHSFQRARWRHDEIEEALLSEALGMLTQLSNEQVQVALDGLHDDYNTRSAYIAYLVKSYQRFQDLRLQVQALQATVDRLSAVSCEVFVSFVVEQFIEARGVDLGSFSQEMASTPAVDDRSLLVDRQQSVFLEALQASPVLFTWANMEGVVCCLDNHIFGLVYEHVFHPNGDSDTLRDQIYSEHLSRLSQGISLSHKSLQIPPVYHSSCPWQPAQEQLRIMPAYKSPRGKVGCIVRCCKVLISLLQLAKCGDPPGADDLFPVLVYTLIMTNPSSLLSTVSYIKLFCETSLTGEAAYWWAQFSTAVEFTKTLE